MILNKKYPVNELLVIVLFAILLYCLSNIININKHSIVKGLLLIFSIIICSKCTVPTGVICSLLVIVYLYYINGKQKEAFNSGRVEQFDSALSDIARDVVDDVEIVGDKIGDGLKSAGKGIVHELENVGNKVNSAMHRKNSDDSDSDDSDSDDSDSEDSDSDDSDSDDSDSETHENYTDHDHPNDHKKKVDRSEENNLYKQYEKCMYGTEILNKNANNYEDDIDERIDHVNKMDETCHSGDNRNHRNTHSGHHKPQINKLLPKIKDQTNELDKDTKSLKYLIRKFYKSIDDKNLIHRNLVDTRDAFDNANREVIIMVNYVNTITKLNNKSNKKILKYINNINDYINSVNINSTVKKQYKYSSDQNDMKKSMVTSGIDIATTINTIKQLL
jgi:hypothetical protein